MTTGRLWRSTCRRPWERGHPCPRGEKSGEKSGEKNRGGDITPIRLRRSLFFVAPATPAGRPSRRQPGETVQALPGRAGRAGCALPRAPKLPKARSCCRKEWPAIDRLPSCRKSSARITAFPSRRPFAASRSRPRHAPRDTNHGLYGRSVRRGCARVAPPKTASRTAAPAAKSRLPCPELPGIARNCSGGGGALSQCPRTVRRSRWASRRAPFAAAPVALRAASAAANAQ